MCLVAAISGARASEVPVRRVVIALYDGAEEKVAHETRVHRFLAMPLNHLGLIVRQFDVRKARPPGALLARTRGIVTWFTDKSVPDPDRYVKWLWSMARAGRHVVIIGHPGIVKGDLRTDEARTAFDRLFARLGISWRSGWTGLTYATRVSHVDPAYYEFERKLPMILPGYPVLQADGETAKALLTVVDQTSGRRSDLVVVGRHGGYVAGDYALFFAQRGAHSVQRWYLNPFRFFARAFATDADPKPDTTTLSGRRIFYSHVDGDAWHSLTTVEEYHKAPVISAKVIYDKIFRAFPGLPHTLAPVTGDLDKGWYGTDADIALARTIFRLPNVEAGSHTHSHPFSWGFFAYNPIDAERPYLRLYPPRPGKSRAESVWRRADAEPAADKAARLRYPLPTGYQRPRAYAVKPFNLRTEIAGSVAYLEKYILPPGKRVKIVQWSGDTSPGEAALDMTDRAGLANINGGDPRMDGEFTSYSRVSGLARRVGRHWQIYTSGANDHVYTNGWKGNYAGFKRTVESFKHTEMPIRIKPINIYYHLYSAQRQDGLNALLYAFRYARSQRIAPIWTSRFARIVQGFLSARIVALGEDRWRVERRGALQTIRFDRATLKAVDFARSSGVVGQVHYAGSLYVALDSAVASPVVALRKIGAADSDGAADAAYLIDARWRVWSLTRARDHVAFTAQGFGPGAFAWQMPRPGRYRILVTTAKGGVRTIVAETDPRGRLSFTIESHDTDPRRVTVSPVGAS